MVSHDAFRRRDNGDAQSIVDARQVLDRGVDPAAGLGNPLDLADHRLAVEIFQLDLNLRAALALHDRITADVAFALEYLEHMLTQFGIRARDLALVAHLSIADAREQVAERIVHGHRASLLTSSTSTNPGSGPWSPVPATQCATACACGNSRAGAR